MNLNTLENKLHSALEKETENSLKEWLQSKRDPVVFTKETNLQIIKNAWESEYTRLNWNSPVDSYIDEALKNHQLYHGQFYWIFLRDKKVGFFTVYDFQDLPPGLGMFCLFPGLNFGSKIYIFKKLKNFKTFWGFCNSVYLQKFYRKLGFSFKKIQTSIWLIGDPTIWNQIEHKNFELNEMF